jgi:hypothetical protein
MKTDRLEEFVKNNRSEFDHLEPSPEVWEKIKTKTARPVSFRMLRISMRVAAAVIVLLVTSFFVLNVVDSNKNNFTLKTDDPELQELIEAEAFYAHEVNDKLKEIRKCYYTNPELKTEIENDLSELEVMYTNLKTNLKDNISNKAVIEAMIENNRYRLKLVNDVLEQINC